MISRRMTKRPSLEMSLAEGACRAGLIIAILSSTVATGRPAELRSRPAPKCEGRRFDPPPLNRPRTGGGDGCRNEVRPGWGRAFGPSPWFEPPAGATDAGGAPHLLRLCRR